MKNKDFDVEKKAEELLMAVGKELAKNRANYVDALMDETRPNPPLHVELPRKKKFRIKHIVRRTAVLAAVLIVMMGVLVVSSEGVRMKLNSLLCDTLPGSTKIVDDKNLVVDLSKVELKYVPEGFALARDEMIGNSSRIVVYENEENTNFVFTVTKTDQYTTFVDNDRMEEEEILVNDKQAYLFFDGENYIVVWQVGDCTFDLTTSIGKEKTIDIAENVIINE